MLAPTNSSSPNLSLSPEQELLALAETICNKCKAVAETARVTLRAALAAGAALNQAKALVPLGGWKRWLKDNCFMSVRTAQLYQQLADHRDEIEAEESRVPDLSLCAARRLIAKPKSEAHTTTDTAATTDTASPADTAANTATNSAAMKFSKTLTKALQTALSLQRSEESPVPALIGILSKLQARKLDIYDVEIFVRAPTQISGNPARKPPRSATAGKRKRSGGAATRRTSNGRKA
jgi:hypothetical protein